MITFNTTRKPLNDAQICAGNQPISPRSRVRSGLLVLLLLALVLPCLGNDDIFAALVASRTKAAEWSPLDLDNLVIWIGPSDESTILTRVGGDGVTRVTNAVDKSGNGYDLTGRTGYIFTDLELRYTNSINGLMVFTMLSGDQGNVNYSCTEFAGNDQPLTVAMVLQRHTGAKTAWSTWEGSQPLHRLQPQTDCRRRGDSDTTLTVPETFSSSDVYVYVHVFSGTTFSTYNNGAKDVDNAAFNRVAASFDSISLGSFRGGVVNPWIGHIGEMVACNEALSDADRETLENYLINKWGIE